MIADRNHDTSSVERGGLAEMFREPAAWLVVGFFLIVTNVKFPLTRPGIVLAVLSYSSVVGCVALVALRRSSAQERVGWRGWLTLPVVAVALAVLTNVLLGSATVSGADAVGPGSAGGQALGELALGLGMIIVVGPFTEEWLFRGWLLPARAGIGALLINAALFSLAHDVKGAVPIEVFRGYMAYFVAGLGLAVTRRVTGNTWYSMGVHAVMNLLVGGLIVIDRIG